MTRKPRFTPPPLRPVPAGGNDPGRVVKLLEAAKELQELRKYESRQAVNRAYFEED